jgi:biopolymer transport protein ExbB
MSYLAKLTKSAAALILCCLPVAATAGTWWNGDWKFRKEVTFDLSPTGAAVAGSAQDVPVLVRLSLANFNYFGDAKPDGSDFRVVAGDDKTPLKFHFERYDSQNQMAFLWVGVPNLTGGAKSDKIYIYYGNPGAATAADPAGTFDVNQVLSLDFSQESGLPADSTAYKNAPTASTAEIVPASLIGGGAKFSAGQRITVPASPSLRLLPTQGFTASAWVKFDQPQAQAEILNLAEQSRELTLGIQGGRAFARYSGGSAPVTVAQASGELGSGQWHLLALTAGSGQLKLYVDGVSEGEASVTLQEIGGVLTIGSNLSGANSFTGELDQVGVAKLPRSADWVKAVARSEGTEAPLVVYGADGQKEGGGQVSYFATIAKNLTVDGWVVIVICLTMLVIALIIMFLKAIYLSKVEKANGRFLADYHKLSGDSDAGALDQDDGDDATAFDEETSALAGLSDEDAKYGASTLYRLYHNGIAELNKRVASGRAAGARPSTVMSPQSIEAIRASMDATMTRLGQRMSSQMVLLTIAISGGPFLGLLGTVIGVMITFAAIALSGDVNVNAIAPGTAAALAATVAGLSVAIPCLFGYNWLNTRIKSINANNRVFLDEFVARIAEQYS